MGELIDLASRRAQKNRANIEHREAPDTGYRNLGVAEVGSLAVTNGHDIIVDARGAKALWVSPEVRKTESAAQARMDLQAPPKNFENDQD